MTTSKEHGSFNVSISNSVHMEMYVMATDNRGITESFDKEVVLSVKSK